MKKIYLTFALLLSGAVFAQKSSGKDFSDFEASLTGASSTDAAYETSPDSASSVSDFENSLMNRSSEEEPIFMARDELLEAVKNRNVSEALSKIESLESMDSENLVALSQYEKEEIYIELDEMKALLNSIVKYYKAAYGRVFTDKNIRFVAKEGDPLALYILKQVDGRDSTRNILYQIAGKIGSSTQLDDREKEKLELLLLVRTAYVNKLDQNKATNLAKDFVREFPDDPDAEWINKSIYGPLEKLRYTSYKFKMRKVNKEHNIQEKLYSGGFGINLGMTVAGFTIGHLYRSDLFEPNYYLPLNVELYTQISRFAVSAEILNSGAPGVWGFGLGLGYVLYDSRHFKVRPYLGVYSSNFYGYQKEPIGGMDNDLDYPIEGTHLSLNNVTLAVNGDYKFGTAYFFTSAQKLVSFALTAKAGLSLISLDEKDAKGTALNGFATIGLGVYFW